MNATDWLKIVLPLSGLMVSGFIWLGRKLEIVDELHRAGLPSRVLKLEVLAGIK